MPFLCILTYGPGLRSLSLGARVLILNTGVCHHLWKLLRAACHTTPCTCKAFMSIVMLVQGEAVEDFTQLSRERLEHTFNVNIIGMIRLAQEVVEHMPAGGSIINVSLSLQRDAH